VSIGLLQVLGICLQGVIMNIGMYWIHRFFLGNFFEEWKCLRDDNNFEGTSFDVLVRAGWICFWILGPIVAIIVAGYIFRCNHESLIDLPVRDICTCAGLIIGTFWAIFSELRKTRIAKHDRLVKVFDDLVCADKLDVDKLDLSKPALTAKAANFLLDCFHFNLHEHTEFAEFVEQTIYIPKI
jgi:hypothetical protein